MCGLLCGRCSAPLVVGIGAVAEDLEDGQIGGILWVGRGQSLDLRCLEQLGKEVGAGMGGGADDEVSDLAGRAGRFGEGDEWLDEASQNVVILERTTRRAEKLL